MVPAIAIADALRAEGADVVFVGGERAEAELVPPAGYQLEAIRVEGLSRSNPLKAARAAARAAGAVRSAHTILRRHRPDAVLGGGGYVAGPVGLAGLARRLPLVLAEADSHLGVTNRLLAPRARRVCLAFPIAGRDDERYVVTGRAVPATYTDRDAARRALGIDADELCVLVFGGSLGARSINEASLRAFADAPFHILHVAGRRDFAELRSPGPHYDLREYLSPFGQALAASDLAVARAGGSVFELAQYGLPGVLIPYPHASADHQAANARWMQEAGAAVIIADVELTAERLARTVGELAADRPRLSRMAAASRALARPHAARDIANEVLRSVR